MSTNRPNPQMNVIALLMLLVALILLFIALMRMLPKGFSDVIPQPYPSTEPPSANQEASVRKALKEDGWQEILGEEDTAIARSLNLKGQPVADYLGYKDGGHWLVAEVKGIDILQAEAQLRSTFAAVLRSGLPTNSFEFRIYLNANAYTRVQASTGYGGYFIRSGYLERFQAEQFIRVLINGAPIQVLPLP
jgi:hypothetical protein